jgi:hypothetical protein
VKRQEGEELLWGVIVETEAYCQCEPACQGHRSHSPSNEYLFGEPVRFYVDVSYGIHRYVNVFMRLLASGPCEIPPFPCGKFTEQSQLTDCSLLNDCYLIG